MWFLFLAGCYERMVVELRVDARHGCVEVTEEQQGWDAQIGEEACASATACLTAIQARLHEERTRLATNGAQEVTNGVFLRDGELGFRTRYRARLDAPIFTEGGYLDRVQILDRNARPRDVVAIWEGPPEQGRRAPATSWPTGPATTGPSGSSPGDAARPTSWFNSSPTTGRTRWSSPGWPGSTACGRRSRQRDW